MLEVLCNHKMLEVLCNHKIHSISSMVLIVEGMIIMLLC